MSEDCGWILRYWGKSPSTDDPALYHPAAYHCLDVAATGEALLEAQPLVGSRLARAAGLSLQDLNRLVAFLLALHDIGKLADGFQKLRPDLLLRLQDRSSTAGYQERHDLLGYRLLVDPRGPKPLTAAGLMAEGDKGEDFEDLLRPWLSASMGHHGVPPRVPPVPEDLGRQFPSAVTSDAVEFVRSAAALFLPQGFPFQTEPYRGQRDRFRRASWLFAGLAVAADWIGSNSEWFPSCCEPMSLEKYWKSKARPQARPAVESSAMAEQSPSRSGGLQRLWPGFETPTPLQALAQTLDLPEGPQVVIVEEVTGGGKTEAALILAHRWMEQGRASGMYLALPTMATANAMYRRVRTVYRRLFDENATPSLVLAHGKRHLFLPLEDTKVDTSYAPGETTASLDCSAWFSDSRKKALLAQVGVGTIDQALIAVLPLRHQSLRLWGLAGKVLIVDEVHACDTYVHGLLCDLLEFHAAYDGSVILMSATLPADQRRDLLGAFARGAGFGDPPQMRNDYPLVSHLSAEGLIQKPVAARADAARSVQIRPLRTEREVELFLASVLDSGGCVAWIRNSVNDALEAYEYWRKRLDERVQVFHSRFTVVDRADLEKEILARFGPHGTPEERRGRLLIATQVIEQSLDLDFDLLVSDLAPIDLLVQRAGREHRHRRDAAGRRIKDPSTADGRGPALLGLYGPEPLDSAPEDWFEGAFPRGAWVYRDHGRLWLTARWLESHGAFRMPEDARSMIEFVYGPESEDRIPSALREWTEAAEGERLSEKVLARQNALKLNLGYETTALDWQQDVWTPTRLGEPTVTLRLVRRTHHGLEPWAGTKVDHPWERSQVQVRESQVAAEDPRIGAELEALKARMPDQGRYVLVAVLEKNEAHWTGSALNLARHPVQLAYRPDTGLQLTKESS